MGNTQKLEKRKMELLNRTSLIFGGTPEDSIDLFNRHKSSIIITNDTSIPFINTHLKTGDLSLLPWDKKTFVIEGKKYLFTQSKEFKEGDIYIQNASSLLPVIALNAKPEDLVLDMCAAPGGKTIQISKRAKDKAVLIVNDENPTRITAMKRLFSTYNVGIQGYYTQPAQYLSKHLPLEHFDKILLDAPCSGEGLINISDINTLGYWSTKKIKRLNKLQKSMIAEAYKLLKVGGTLVYSTCTMAPEENEEVISWALDNLKGWEVQDVIIDGIDLIPGLTEWKGKKLNEGCKKCVRVKPNEIMEAFFVCKLKKRI
jgi:16S rRNA (cytosine1407-C5)-methyltransferase